MTSTVMGINSVGRGMMYVDMETSSPGDRVSLNGKVSLSRYLKSVTHRHDDSVPVGRAVKHTAGNTQWCNHGNVIRGAEELTHKHTTCGS